MTFTLRLLNLKEETDQAVFKTMLNNFAQDDTGGMGKALSQDVLNRSMELILKESHAFSFVGELDGEPVSLLNAYKIISTWTGEYRLNLHDLVVKEGLRGKGIGRRTLEAIKDWCKEQGITHQTLEVDPDNTRALELYKKVGFEEVYVYMKRSVT